MDAGIAGNEYRQVFALPALITSSADTKSMIPISMRPSATPVRVEMAIPR